MKCHSLSIAIIIIAVVSSTPAIADNFAKPIVNLDQLHISQAILWVPSDSVTLECVVTNSSGAEPPRIIIYRKISTGWRQLYSEVMGDNIVSMFPASDQSPRLITIWVTGSAIMTRVYMFDKNNIKLVLEAGSRTFPEFVYQNSMMNNNAVNNANPIEREIVIPNVQWLKDRANNTSEQKIISADIYKWDGKKYQVQKNVPWTKRFDVNVMENAVRANVPSS